MSVQCGNDATGCKRNVAIIGGETGVALFEDGHQDAAIPESGHHTPREDDIEEIE